jgi:hypothetical protein
MVAVGYYRSLDGLIQQLVRHCLVDKKGTYTFKEYINEYKNIINSLKQALSI